MPKRTVRFALFTAVATALTIVPLSVTSAATPAPTRTTAVPAGAPAAKAVAPTATPVVVSTPTRTHTYDGGPLQGATRTRIADESFSSPQVGNVLGHTNGDVDVVAGFLDGTVRVWNARTNATEIIVQTGGAIQSSVALVRPVAGQPLAVLVGNNAGHLYMYRFSPGKAVVLFHKHVNPIGTPSVNGFFGTPTMADLDNDGRQWIIATSWDQHLYVWDMLGRSKTNFPYFAQDTIWSSPVVAKMDGDPYPQIIFGYDCSGVPGESCYARWHSHGGVVVALRHDGRPAAGWPQFVSGQTVWSTAAVASLFAGNSKQIIIGTGLYWPNAGRATLVFDAHGRRLATIPMTNQTFSSPAIGDVLGKGYPQIVIGSADGYTDIIDNGWHRLAHVCTATTTHGCAASHSSPVLADLDGDGRQEVIAVGSNNFHVINYTKRSVVNVTIPETVFGLAASPTVYNIGGKATAFFALAGRTSTGFHAMVMAYTFSTTAGASAWPMFKYNMNRVGNGAKYVPVPH
jgi:hypothetical protein